MQDLLGDLIPKRGGNVDQSKACFPTKGERSFSQEGKVYSKEGDMPSESSHEGEVAKKGENERGNHGFRGRPSHHWMMGEIVTNMTQKASKQV